MAPRTSVTIFNGVIFLLVIAKVKTRASRQECAYCLKTGISFLLPLLSIGLLGIVQSGEKKEVSGTQIFKINFLWTHKIRKN